MPFTDPAAVTVAMILAAVPAAVLFLADTLVRRDLSAGRVWAVGFLALAASALGRLAAFAPGAEPGLALVFCDLCLTAFVGSVWAGAVRFNGHRTRTASVVSGAVVLGVMAASLAGVLSGVLLVRTLGFAAGLAALAVLGALEFRRGRTARGETILLSAALFLLGGDAAIVLVVQAVPALRDVPELAAAFGPVGIVTLAVPLTVVALATTMMLRAGDRIGPVGQRERRQLRLDEDGLLDAASFDEAVELFVSRAERTGEQVAVLAMVAMDLPEIGAALGGAIRERLERFWRESWVRHAPLGGITGLGGPDRLLLVLAPSTLGEANRVGNRIYSRVIEDLAGLEGATLPVTGFGVAISGTIPVAELVARACAAAERSTAGSEAGRLVAEGEDVIERTLGGRE